MTFDTPVHIRVLQDKPTVYEFEVDRVPGVEPTAELFTQIARWLTDIAEVPVDVDHINVHYWDTPEKSSVVARVFTFTPLEWD